MKSQRKQAPKAITAALASMAFVQSGASIAKTLFPAVGAIGTSSLRIGLSAVLLTLVNRPKFRNFTKLQWFYCSIYGLGIAAMNGIFYLAIQRIPLGLGVTVEFIGPLFLALALSRKLSDVLWALLACIGILCIVPWQSQDVDTLGLLLAFTAGIFWALYIVMGSKVAAVMPTKDAVTAGMLIAAGLILPFAIYQGGLLNLSPVLFLKALAVAVLSSALPFSLDLIALKELPAKTFSVLTSLQPAFAAFSGLLFLGEHLTLLQWISIVCVVSASIGATLYRKK